MGKKIAATKNIKPELTLDQIKRLTITAMFADDEMYETLVLKGGNAMNLIHRLGTRASVDLDFSMQFDLPEGQDEFCVRIKTALNKIFQQSGYVAFDVKMDAKPKAMSEDMADFWGGYAVEFKLIRSDVYEQHPTDLEELRKRAISLGQGKKFLIDLSRFEYTEGKQKTEFDGYQIFVYTLEMIVCEKLRAICQQMPEYAEVIKRGRPGTARARDFYDIFLLMSHLKIDIDTAENIETLKGMFEAKKVPLNLLGKIQDVMEFHRSDFAAVAATVDANTELEDFEFYFYSVVALVEKLKALWNV